MTANYISDLLVQGIGTSLVHSLWQGALVAIVLRLLLYAIPQSRVQLKYWLSVTALTAVVFWVGYTLNQQILPLTEVPTATEENSWNLSYATSAIHSTTGYQLTRVTPVLNKIEALAAPYHNTLVTVWFLGVVFFLIRLQGSIFYLRKMRNIGSRQVPLVWQKRAEHLTKRLGIRNHVKLVESKLAEVPMVIGHIKPMILIPVGMLSGLSTAEVEAILAHELAHIKRYDYLINIVQTIIESLLFFNPAVWWISQTIRKSREHCCDDMAVRCCGDQIVYANALSNLGAWSLQPPALGMGLFKNKNELLMRIKRLVYPQGGNQTVKEKVIPGFVLALTVLCLSWYSHRVQAQLVPSTAPNIPAAQVPQVQPDPAASPDTIPPALNEEDVLPPMEPTEGFGESFDSDPDIDVDFDVDVDFETDFEITAPNFGETRDFGNFEEGVLILPPSAFAEAFMPPPGEFEEMFIVPDEFVEVPDMLINIDVPLDSEHFQHVMKDIQIQFDDTTRERIMQALELQREALERAKIEQTKALEKARAEMRKSMESSRPEDLTEEEWEMAKRQIERAEKSIEMALRQSELALEQAFHDQQHTMHKQMEHMVRDAYKYKADKHKADKHKIIIRQQIEDNEQDQINRQIADAQAMARVHRFGDQYQYQWSDGHTGNEAKLRRAMARDGLIDDYEANIDLTFSKSQLKVNGIKLEGEVKQKYRDMLDDMFGENSTGSLTFSR
ncbi:MAG: hypothetical protein DHS20C17_25420 [Cyclobacteriaceae bacterium]|nr:MAG: hypothetical protein DHS20C17_25420 [Cyclobacteriaceae bacterium]